MKVKVFVDDKNYVRRINRMMNKINTNSAVTTRQVATLLANRAKLYAPKDTGETAKFIKIIPVKLTKDEKSYVVGYEENGFGVGNPHPDRYYSEGEFSLPLWMHTSNKARNYFTNGYPKFLYKASADTRKDFEGYIRKVVQDALSIKVK